MFKLIFFDSIKISCESNSMAKHLNKYRNIAPEWNKYRKSHELFRIFLCLACLSIDSIGWIKCVPVSVLSTFICQKMLSAFALFDKWTDFTWFLYSDHRGSRRILRMYLMKKFQTYFCCLWFYSSLFPQFYSNSFYANNYKMARLYIEMEKKHRNEEKKEWENRATGETLCWKTLREREPKIAAGFFISKSTFYNSGEICKRTEHKKRIQYRKRQRTTVNALQFGQCSKMSSDRT